jgi:hypothetical protein
MNQYEYQIKTQELIPSVGINRFMAICFISKYKVGKITVDFGNVWGRTEKEAEEKMEIKVDEWIKSNTN